MDVNSLPKTVTRQRRGWDLNAGPTAPESSTLTTRLPSHVHPLRSLENTNSSQTQESACFYDDRSAQNHLGHLLTSVIRVHYQL